MEKVGGGMSISAEVASPGGVGGSVAGAKRNGADGAWEASGIVEGKEGEAAGVTGDWAGGGGEVEEDVVSSVCAGRTGTEGRSAIVV